MLRAVFLLHICSNYYIYVVELTKALAIDPKIEFFFSTQSINANRPLAGRQFGALWAQ